MKSMQDQPHLAPALTLVATLAAPRVLQRVGVSLSRSAILAQLDALDVAASGDATVRRMTALLRAACEGWTPAAEAPPKVIHGARVLLFFLRICAPPEGGWDAFDGDVAGAVRDGQAAAAALRGISAQAPIPNVLYQLKEDNKLGLADSREPVNGRVQVTAGLERLANGMWPFVEAGYGGEIGELKLIVPAGVPLDDAGYTIRRGYLVVAKSGNPCAIACPGTPVEIPVGVDQLDPRTGEKVPDKVWGARPWGEVTVSSLRGAVFPCRDDKLVLLGITSTNPEVVYLPCFRDEGHLRRFMTELHYEFDAVHRIEDPQEFADSLRGGDGIEARFMWGPHLRPDEGLSWAEVSCTFRLTEDLPAILILTAFVSPR